MIFWDSLLPLFLFSLSPYFNYPHKSVFWGFDPMPFSCRPRKEDQTRTSLFMVLRVIEWGISAFSLPLFRKVLLFFTPLWQRGVRGDFINHKQLHIPSITPPIFSKTSLSENLRTLIPIFLRASSLVSSFTLPASV